jgi:hypothetical protein
LYDGGLVHDSELRKPLRKRNEFDFRSIIRPSNGAS